MKAILVIVLLCFADASLAQVTDTVAHRDSASAIIAKPAADRSFGLLAAQFGIASTLFVGPLMIGNLQNHINEIELEESMGLLFMSWLTTILAAQGAEVFGDEVMNGNGTLLASAAGGCLGVIFGTRIALAQQTSFMRMATLTLFPAAGSVVGYWLSNTRRDVQVAPTYDPVHRSWGIESRITF